MPCFVLWVNVSLRVSVHPAVHVCNSVCVLCAASLFGTRPGSGLLQSHIPPAPLCSVLQKIFAFSTTHNFSSSIATRCGSCGPCPHGNGGSSSRGSLLWRLPWELACCRPEGVGRECMSGSGVSRGPSISLPQVATWIILGGFSAWVLPGLQATASGPQGSKEQEPAAESTRGAPPL